MNIENIKAAMKTAEETYSLQALAIAIPSSEWVDPNSTGECVRVHIPTGEMMDVVLDDGGQSENPGWWVRRYGVEDERTGRRSHWDDPMEFHELAVELADLL